MGYPFLIGSCRGEVLLDLEGLFRVVKLEGPCGEALFEEISRTHFVGVIVLGQEALFFDGSGGVPALKASWSERWLEGLLRLVSAADPFRAEEVAKKVFLRRIYSQALEGGLEVERSLQILKRQAEVSEMLCLRRGDFARARVWQAWVREIEDFEKRLHNLQLMMGRFAIRLGNRWLKGEKP